MLIRRHKKANNGKAKEDEKRKLPAKKPEQPKKESKEKPKKKKDLLDGPISEGED